jgi:hypothetical protein
MCREMCYFAVSVRTVLPLRYISSSVNFHWDRVIGADVCTKSRSSSSHDSGSLRFMPVVVFNFSLLLPDMVRSFGFVV